ncbi:nAD dependent epimerase/dehydratase family protein [Clostridium sp. CAG:1013]|nr:nAD dependent epimerase/dehydratase family protein [Clostridium sp. CAG:1013]
MKNVYIVTGASGFLGSNLVRLLTQDPENQVRALVLPGDPSPGLEGLSCQIYYGDVTQEETLEELFQVPEDVQVFVIHCAAVVSIKSKKDPKLYQVNVEGTKHVVEKTLAVGGKLIYVNSVHAIPEKPKGQTIREVRWFDPDQVEGQYAKTKAQAAQLVLEAVWHQKLNACIVQPSGMIGPYDYSGSHLTQLFLDLCSGQLRASVKGGYDFVDVRDVAQGILEACSRGRPGESYILSNRRVEIRELLDLISQAARRKKIKVVLPMWLARATAPLSELYYAALHQPPLYTSYSLYTLRANSQFSHHKATLELGYQPRELSETVEDTVSWLEEAGMIAPLTGKENQ